MRPLPMHAPASEKPRPRRTTATNRPDATALASTVSPPLPRNGLPALQARKVKVGKGKEKQRHSLRLDTYTPSRHSRWQQADPHTLNIVASNQPTQALSTQSLATSRLTLSHSHAAGNSHVNSGLHAPFLLLFPSHCRRSSAISGVTARPGHGGAPST